MLTNVDPITANSFRSDFSIAQNTVKAGISAGRAKSTLTA